jgi:EAL domain-containing protein (putative c-di-GMP-specific phosphodiesterase class I)/GGDEF domain-containing protein
MRENGLLYDTVSGVYNKAAFMNATQKVLEQNTQGVHYLIQFDIVRFKIVNEFYSFSEGDLLLRHIGETLRLLALPGETYGRLRDDVFCICVDRTGQQAIELVGKLEKKINEYLLPFQFQLTAGIVRIEAYDGQPVDILCDRAALAQKSIKGRYVRRYAFYDHAMSDILNREHCIIGSMYRALQEEQFIVYLQPKFDLYSHRISGAEALVRWQHPSEGMILPGEFIPIFEQNGFILQLDEYVWEQTCRLLQRWLRAGYDPPPVSINVSRLHIYNPNLCEKLISLVEQYEIPPHLLELEITESAYIEYPQMLYTIMDKLQERGFIFLMDDFGSGYSSLNALKDIPVDAVKIDLHFLHKPRRGEETGRGILASVISLVRGIGLSVIAEGVETREQAEFLVKAGCPQAQGYYFARPMPVENYEAICFKNESNVVGSN